MRPAQDCPSPELCISENNGTIVKVMTKCFITMKLSIATYGCELWGAFGWRKTDASCIGNYSFSNNHIFENLHIKFCKQALGIGIQTPNIIAKSDLAITP